MAAQGIVRVHQDEQGLTFQVEGQATMQQSPPLRQCAEQALAFGITSLRVDLRRCTYMDSTFLGTLLFLKRTVEQKSQGQFALACLSPQCQKLLKQMGLEGYYPVLTTPEPPPEAWIELKGGPGDARIFQNIVLQAHQELANVPGPAGEPFREVMRCVARDQEAQRRLQARSSEPGTR